MMNRKMEVDGEFIHEIGINFSYVEIKKLYQYRIQL